MNTSVLYMFSSPWKEVGGVPTVHHHFGPCFDKYLSSAKQGCYHTALTDDNGRKRILSLREVEDPGVLSEQVGLVVPYKYSNGPSQCLRG